MDKNAVTFNPFMHARISECIGLRDSIAQTSAVEKIEHVISSKNITDLCTRRDAKLADIGPGSLWQQGPKWLLQPRSMWLSTRDFCRESFLDVETRSPIKILVTRTTYHNLLIIFTLDQSLTFDEAVQRLARCLWS